MTPHPAARRHTRPQHPRQPRPARALARGTTLRCPVCGHGGLFRRWLSMVERCPGCGFRFEREAGHWVGSLGLNTVISFGTLLVAIVVGVILTAPDVPVAPLTTAVVIVALVTPLAVFPLTRSLWSALDLLMRPLEPGELPDEERAQRTHHAEHTEHTEQRPDPDAPRPRS